MNAQSNPVPSELGEPSTRLLEELLQIARTSALEELASGIAHELNQPIGAIATFAHTGKRMLDRQEPMVSAAREVLQDIAAEALKAGNGIHRIRRLFDLAAAAHVECHLADVINELLPVVRLLAQRCGATISFQACGQTPRVRIDPRRIQHVVYTLVQNALEAGHAHGDQTQVRIELDGDRYAATASVVDNGAGVRSDIEPNLFRPFFTTKPNGTGLGLASSRAIVEAHGGTIGFDRSRSEGARFWFRLPAAGEAS